jgi:thioredoxin 1
MVKINKISVSFCAAVLVFTFAMCEKKPVETVRQAPPQPPAAQMPATDTGVSQPAQVQESTGKIPSPPSRYAGIREVKSAEHFREIMEGSGDGLVVFELYADWCMPCKMLSPVLTALAKQYYERAWFYKINTDLLPQIASMFGAKGIPFVAFIKEKKNVHSLVGVQPKTEYEQAILKFGAPQPASQAAGVKPASGR